MGKISMTKISVIVPVYNAENYLKQCIDSLINQTLNDIEIILLNDGSTDLSLNICNEYALKDDRIKVYSHPNMGLGCTRNKGISVANGEYLAFVDSDDYIALYGLEAMYNEAKKQCADIIQGEEIWFYENGRPEHNRYELSTVDSIHVVEKNKITFYRDYYFSRIYSHNACDKLYRRKFVLAHNIQFGDNKRIFAEDNSFQLNALLFNPRIAFLPEKYYWYRQQAQSIMHQPKKNLVQRHGAMISDYNKLLEINRAGEVERKVCSLVAIDVFTIEALNVKNCDGKYKEFSKELKKISNNTDLLESIKDVFRIKSYKYVKEKKKRLFLFVISFLYVLKIESIANRLVWLMY